ncbi:MAG TPA: polymorphic toxin-type HINT domain-containing protein [Thermoanaerobaculia bacterium]|nr:polymorphic toxin-type HINT domain-containing protein [Thermoanaerobaculia bacterium]
MSLFGSGQQGAPVAGAVTDGRGRFVLAGEVPAGRYVLVSAGEDTTRVYRRLSLRPAAGVVPFDSRVTPLAQPAGTLEAAGGSVTFNGLTFAADAAALPGAAPVAVRLTPLSGQGLPDFLPLGWTPVAAAEVRLEQEGGALAEQGLWTSGAASLELTLAAGAPSDGLVAVRYEAATGRWLALPDPEPVSAGRVRVALAGPGTVAVVVADAGPVTPLSAGDPLAGVERPEQTPALVADLTLDPPVVAPTGRARARVVARSADGTTPWPSGLAVQAFLEERLVLTGGGEELEAPFSADLVLYHPALTSAEQGGAAPSAAGAMEFMVSPSPRAAQVLLEVGWENIRLFPFPEEVERGPLVGPDGGSVDSPEGVELLIPEGALAAKVPVSASLLTAAELAALPAVAGYDTLAAVHIDLSGATLARPATLALPKPSATPADSQAEPRVVLAELIDAPVDGRGTLARVVSRTRREGVGQNEISERVVAAPELAGLLPLDGVVREGLYLLLAAQQPLGFSTGFVRAGNETPVVHSRVTADSLGTGDMSRLTGRYAVPVPAGASRHLVARHPALDERGEGTIPSLSPGQVVNLDLTVSAVPPRVVSVTPADGSASQPLASAVSVLFSEALDPATVTPSTLTLELAGPDGEATGIFVDGTVTLSEGVRVVFAPKRPLLPGRTFRALFTGGVADAGGAIYTGSPVPWKFSTSTAIVPGGQVHPEKFHVRLPVNGVAEIYGEPGALPGALPGQVPWVVTPEIEGPLADPQRDTFQARGDGSFTGTVGHPPGFAVTLGSRIWVKVFDPTGTLAAEFRVGPFTTPDGRGFVAPPGEAVTFRSAEGLVVDVPAGAFSKPTLVRVRLLQSSALGLPVPQGLGLGAFVDVDFEGEAAETLRLSVPAPANAADGAQVFIGQPVNLPWGRRLQILSVGGVMERDGQRYLSNDPSLQPEPELGALTGAARSGGMRLAAGSAKSTCQKARQEGLPKCFLQSMMMEFTLRSHAAFMYEMGVSWSLISGLAQPFPMMLGIAQEAIFNNLADMWVYLPVPHDWNGGFVLPVISTEPLELTRRDTATGWVLARQTYDPVGDAQDLISVGFLGSGQAVRPLLLDARPFQLYRLAAPEPEDTARISLEIEMEADNTGAVTVASAAGFKMPAGTTVALYDLSPTTPEPVEPTEETEPEPQPEAPIAGPTVSVCDPDAPWTLSPMNGSDDMLIVVSPGGLDAAALDQFELQFDQPLKDVTSRPVDEVARLLDLGPLEPAGCGSATEAGYPKKVALALDQVDQRSRLVILPLSALAAGHRFRLEIVPSALTVDDPEGSVLAYWQTAPTRFEFATREVPGEPISELPGDAFGTSSVARDMLKLGNLLLVASETGDLLAVDVSRASDEEGLRRYAVKNKGVQSATRALATDGHNRIFYAGLFGMTWGIKAMRLEDVRDADAECVSPPSWAAGLPCFEGVEGSVRVSYALGATTGTTASEWLALGTMPEATPMKMSVLAQDEKGRTLELADFAQIYAGGFSALIPDAEGIYTFNVALESTLTRSQDGELEPSLVPGTVPEPAVAEWRKKVCDGEEDYDRYQRVTIDNLTTGQTWSIDVENPWPDGGVGNGQAVVTGVRARKGDQLQVRYNLRTLGHVALLGSGITVVDLNRFYRLLQPGQSPGGGQCGRRLGKFEGQQLEFPSCAPASIDLEGIRMTAAVVTHGRTGCEGGNCRGAGFIDIYSPLTRVGALHTRSTETSPGGVENGLLGTAEGPEALQFSDLAGCIQTVNGQHVMLRDVALANDVEWIYRGVHGDLSGTFQAPPETAVPLRLRGDLLFVSLGAPGVYVFDVSSRSLLFSGLGGSSLVGHLSVPDHSAFRLQVDPVRNLLFAGGTHAKTGKPVIDVWDISSINGGPDLDARPTPVATLNAPWSTNQLGVDAAGTGLVYTWGAEDGPLVVPFDRAQFVLSGVYRAEDEEDDRPISGVHRPTSRFVPLGVPMEATLEDERDDRKANEKLGTAAFKVRVALPGSLGPELTAKVQSLRSLPGEESLGQADVGPSVALPGGPGWPENEVIVRLRRVGVGSDEGAAGLEGESGPLGTAYHLYESVETVLLLADPRARSGYRRQDDPADQKHDEEAQCRRCAWPDYLPNPEGNDPALENVEELLAGRYVRAFLFASDEGGNPTKAATEEAIAFFEARGRNYPLPAGWAEVAGPADAVPSPLQVSLAEPAQSPAVWGAGEAGVSVAMPGGEVLLAATDHSVDGRALPFSLDRTYRSGMLGYGAFGSAGWTASLFAHLRELPVTGEVEYHDGMGHVWRFFPRTLPEAPEGYEEDDAGSYYMPAGVYMRLQKLSGGQGWRLIGRTHDVALFDGMGRLMEASDRHYRGGTSGEQGNRIQLRYDPFGQLRTVVDDLQRQYRFEYFEDPLPEAEGGDGIRYGLLKSVTDFADRKVEYEYDGERRLAKVKLPEVENPVDDYSSFSYTGGNRPALEYRYDPTDGVTSSEEAAGALLHGEFAKLRLGESRMPDFVEGASGVPRVRFTYESATGRVDAVGFPTPGNVNSSTSSVEWGFSYSGAFPSDRVTLRTPWDHEIQNTLNKGRIVARREDLPVQGPGVLPVTTSYTYAEDGRLLTQDRPDGSQLGQCYADGEGCGGGGALSGGDRLAKGNVVGSRVTALTAAAKGSADYDTVETGAAYGADNQLSSMEDGLGRGIDVATAMPGQSSKTSFNAENVSASYTFDLYGRVTETSGGGAGSPQVRIEYGKDAKGKEGAGLVERIERGSGAFWEEFTYDDAYNVERVDTSQGSITLTDHDTWDRPVRNVSGLSADGRFAQVGVAECSDGEGAVSERAYDRAGHVVRERRLQDYIDPVDGGAKCRWVEVRYTYNAREQLVSMQETHLASAVTPGQVEAGPQTTAVYEYDSFGRLERERSKAVSRPDLVKTNVFDSAGRVSATQVGSEGARQVGYDAMSRVVLTTDGHENVWLGSYDAWGHLYQETDASGAVVRRRFDQAGNPIQETVFDGDPLAPSGARVLSDAKSSFTSFGAMERMVQALIEPVGSTPAELRITENRFDGSGRVTEVWSGPPNPDDASRVDMSRARREVAIQYEPAGGRVQAERFGGDAGTAPLHGVIYQYGSDSLAPWPDVVTTVESVPGEADLRPTLTTAYRRDVLGRPVEERRSDGSLLLSTYDRIGGVIRVRTGAGAESTTSLDSRGLPVKVVRPNGRGFTLYSYDLDGAMLRQETRTSSADLWATAYTYDATGRVSSVTYADGTTEQVTYNPDSTLQTLRTRDGLLLTHGYDAANRLKTVTPAAVGTTPTLLDAGDALDYDRFSRPTLMQRGRAGASGYDPALAVSYPGYDLASRPSSEVVGSRAPLSWRFDTWDRPVEVRLPAGAGRNPGNPFQGFSRSFDTLDRLAGISGLGASGLSATPVGADWAWGGAGRLYGVTTKGALRTAARFGYHGGAGQQVPGYDPDESADWKLATVIWGSAGTSPVNAAPQTPWGSFGFGWRGNEGAAADGTKTGRKVLGLSAPSADLFAGMGWAFGYDAGVRLSFAASGAGDLSGGLAPGADADVFRFNYGTGDELARIVREATGQIAELETGDYGRILARNGAPFSYDGVGRRLEDDRFVYRWDWRDQLVSVTVKDTWPDADGDGEPDATPWAGHQVRYEYDAAGRMTHRWHTGKLPEEETDDALRPFLEKRVFVWEGDSLAAEAAYGNAEETIFRWRKTYVPGPSGLDDAVQVVVEDVAGTARTYTLLRDEMGTVVGLVAEDEGNDPARPPVPARYHYTPYGEAHVETGPELERARFDGDVRQAGTVTQTVADERAVAGGAMVLDWSLELDGATLPGNLVVERLVLGLGWLAMEPADVAVETASADARLLVLARNGWQRGTSYRVRLTGDLQDELGRRFGRTESLEWRVPEAPANGPIPPVLFDKTVAVRYESWAAAKDDLGGRFPGGQTALFQGLWTDPVTGVSYARARWYDARNAAWLSEDPMADVDSPNLYAFVGWQPTMATDPLGLCSIWEIATNEANCGKYFVEGLKEEFLTKEMLSTAISFVPGLGDIKDAQEAITGVDLITGRELSWMERGITVVAAVVPVVGGAALRQALGNVGEHAAKEGVNALEEGAEQALKRSGDVAGEGAERAAREGAAAVDDVSPPHRSSDASAKPEPPCPVNFTCFAAGTLVATSAGLLPIEQVQAGDQVYAYDDATGEEHLAEVVALHHRDVEATWVLEVGDERIETTDEHPFYVAGQGWTEAQDLKAGDLLVATGGDRLSLDKVERVEGSARVYNFEVRDLHSYFVGTVGVVVHNCTRKVRGGDLNGNFRAGSEGEVRSVFARIEQKNLGDGTPTTEASRDFARRLGNDTDDAGHAIGRNLGGRGGATSGNIFPQAPSVNRGAFRQFEKAIAGEVDAGKKVFVRVRPRYTPGSTRPYEILYQVRIDGRTISRIFANP